jgi:phosphatidylglycerol:prolipoprotein diacylglycerol transferase
MVALGFAAGVFLIYLRAKEFGVDKNKAVDLFIIILLCGVIGGRALYVISNPAYYMTNPLAAINLSEGGLVWYGAFTLGLFAAALYMSVNRMRFWNVMDMASPYIALGQAFGRIGCLLNGCCYGIAAPDGFPLGVVFPGSAVVRYPAQIYSSLALILIFVILRLWQDKRRFEGEVFLGYLMLYSCKRFLIEFLRGDNPRILLNLTQAQMMSITVFLIAVAVFARKAHRWRKSILS